MKKSSNKNSVVLLMAILLLIAIFYGFKQKVGHDKLKGVYAQEKIELEAELEEMTNNYKNISVKNKTLSSRIIKEINKLILLKDSVKNLKEENYSSLNSFRKNLRSLRNENKKLHSQVDSLKYVNISLKEENLFANQLLEQKSTKNIQLETKNNDLEKINNNLNTKMSVAQKIKISPIIVVAMKEKSSGKLAMTTKAKKTDAFRINFELLENELAVPGVKKVYIQIHDQHNNVIAPRGKVDLKNGETILYSTQLSAKYKNEDLEILSLISLNEEKLNSEDYKINVFVDGVFKSSSVVELN